jgi:hypothetical protein
MNRNETRISPTRLVPMTVLLLLLLLWAAESVGWFALLFLLPIALLAVPLCEEGLYLWLIFVDLAVAAIVLLLPAPHYAWLAFVCVLAPYVPVRHALRGMKRSYHATLLCVGIVTVFTVLVLFGLFLLGVHPYTDWNLPEIAFAILGFFLFLFLLDAGYHLYLKFYRKRLKRFLLPRA